jgi:hypothetical protein
MNALHRKKLKSLMAMMLRWAERDKTITYALRKHELPKHAYEVPEDWKKAFEYVTRLENKQENGVMGRLPRIHMIECNKLFREYRC